ncbi:MAG: DUF1697 domain-containing protein [Bacteroidetes bacterium]|nr:DUF1697 domain-containing protein [Bacteroidota bacterium]
MMPTYIAMLRGINVSGHKAIKMEALRSFCETLGFTKVQTYIQSGNIIFNFSNAPCADLEKKIARKILEEFHFEVPVIVMEAEVVRKVSKNNPFTNERNLDLTQLHVTFLAEEPKQAVVSKIKADDYAPDEFVVDGKTVYLYCPGGYGKTKLSNSFFESKLNVKATTRNWKTVNALVALAAL